MSNQIHSTALLSPKARLGNGNTIGPFTIVEDDVELGDNNCLASHSVVKSGVRMGNSNTIEEHAVIGGAPQDMGFDRDTPTYVEIGNDNTFREYVTIHRASKGGEATRVGDENYLMAMVHVAHDCQLANQIVIAPSTGLGGHVHVDSKAFISGGVMVHQFVQIGAFAMIGGNSKITQNCLPYMITDGVPATVKGLNSVGLRRAGFDRQVFTKLKQAYSILFGSHRKLEDKLADLEQLESEQCHYLARFVSEARRGFHRTESE